MQECADGGDWESVDELQGLCRQLSKEVFSAQVSASEAPAFAAAIRELLKINQYIVDLGQSAREICLESVGSLKRSRQAIREYTANTY